jgi:hypothetical protein
MNKKLLIILSVLALVLLSLYLIKGSPADSGFDLSDRAFKIEKPEEVYSVSIERKNYPPVIFQKNGSGWKLNNGREARAEGVNYILSIMTKLRIKFIPNRSAAAKIKESIAKEGIKIKFFDKNDEILKHFMMGPDLGDGTSTAFLMDGADQPYAMEAVGFTGSIRTRFVFDMNEYETKNIFNTASDNIKSIEVKYPKDRPSSFTIERNLIGFDFYNPYTKTKLPSLNEKLIEPYLMNFSNIVAEYNDSSNPYKSLILEQIPFCEITLTDKNGKVRNAKFYNLKNIEFKEENFSPKDEIQEDTRYSVQTNNDEFFLAQHRVIKNFFVAFDNFSKK